MTTRGFKFISYAVWWIRQSILQLWLSSREYASLNQVGSLNRSIRLFPGSSRRMNVLSPEELADVLELPKEKVTDTLKVSGRHVSVDAPFIEDEQ